MSYKILRKEIIMVKVCGSKLFINKLEYLHMVLFKVSKGEYDIYKKYKKMTKEEKKNQMNKFVIQYRKNTQKPTVQYGHTGDDVLWLYGGNSQSMMNDISNEGKKTNSSNEDFWKNVKKTRKKVNIKRDKKNKK